MRRTAWTPLLEATCRHAIAFLDGLAERPVGPRADAAAMRAAVDAPLPAEPSDPRAVIDELVRTVEPGLNGMPSGRFFGWVLGGTLPAAVAADWLTSAWDQNAGTAEGAPAAAAIEQLALRWVAELLEVPAASGALVTGAQMANFVALAAARGEVLRGVGWDLDDAGLAGSPPITIVVGGERHGTLDKALRLLGFGARQLRVVDADQHGRLDPAGLAAALAGDGPAIVCAQAGNINGGACDPLAAIADHVEAARARRPVWLHVDGAFGLWARVAPARRALVDGAERADSWATDAHKWLNTPFDSGIVLLRDAAAHRRAMHGGGAYLPAETALPNPYDHAPELSRRARGFALWAALRELGRRGLSELVERSCGHAAALARGLAAIDGATVMNEVVLNQVVVRFADPARRDDDAHTRATIARTVASGVCFVTPTSWRGRAAMRLSVSNWSTDDHDVAVTLDAIRAAHGGR